jgi:hypothetical protein
MLAPTYLGPYRILKLHELGALLRDPRTGEQCSVHYENLRKLNIDELLCILPTNFDADVLKEFTFRYNTVSQPEKPWQNLDPIDDTIDPDPTYGDPHPDKNLVQDTSFGEIPDPVPDLRNSDHVQDPLFGVRQPDFSDTEARPPDPDPDPNPQANDAQILTPAQDQVFGRRLRSGKIFALNNVQVKVNPNICFTNMSFTAFQKNNENCNYLKPCIKTVFRPTPTVYASSEQKFDGSMWMYNTMLNASNISVDDPREKKTYESGFRSPVPGTLTIDLNFETTNKKIRFNRITVHFY